MLNAFRWFGTYLAWIPDEFAKTNEVITIDGARILFENGWGLVRASNSQPILVVRFEADNAANLAKIQDIVRDKLREYPSVQLDF